MSERTSPKTHVLQSFPHHSLPRKTCTEHPVSRVQAQLPVHPLAFSISFACPFSLFCACSLSCACRKRRAGERTHAATCSNVHGSLGAYRSFQRRRSRKSISAWRGPCCGHYTKILPRRFKIHPRTKYIFLSNFHFWRIQSAPKQETKCVHQKNVDL